MTVVGSCLLHRSSESLQFKSSSATLVLHTACSTKLYSSAAFRILRPQDLQTRSERFSSFVSGNPIEPQHSAKISPTLSSLPDGENRFSNDALALPEVKFTPQNLQLLLFFECLSLVFFLFYKPLWEFLTFNTRLEDFLTAFASSLLWIFFHASLPKVNHAEMRAPYSDWPLNWQLC